MLQPELIPCKVEQALHSSFVFVLVFLDTTVISALFCLESILVLMQAPAETTAATKAAVETTTAPVDETTVAEEVRMRYSEDKRTQNPTVLRRRCARCAVDHNSGARGDHCCSHRG